MTGSGKTAAFLLPILQRLSALPRGTTRALIVAPTRELAAQIDEHRRELSRFTRIDGAAVFGGLRERSDAKDFLRGARVNVLAGAERFDQYGIF